MSEDEYRTAEGEGSFSFETQGSEFVGYVKRLPKASSRRYATNTPRRHTTSTHTVSVRTTTLWANVTTTTESRRVRRENPFSTSYRAKKSKTSSVSSSVTTAARNSVTADL
jgi:hypothetical protein